MATTPQKCVICGKPLGRFGNNPWPLADDGECCDECNWSKVIPARIAKKEEQR